MYINSMPVLETSRLVLREIDISDYIDMYEYAKLPQIGPNAGWQPHRSYTETKRIIEAMIDKKNYGQLGTFAIVLKKYNKMIGTLELHTFIKGYKAELGYTINPNFQNQGYASEAALKAIEWGFKELGLKRIECGSFINNTASQKVCEKLHFTFEGIRKKGYLLYDGTTHDIKCYALTDDEYFSYQYQAYINKL